jgi:hypothetical protein
MVARSMKQNFKLAFTFFIAFCVMLHAEEKPPLPPELTKCVADTHAASLKLREAALRRTIAKDTAWPDGMWGENLWCLSALYLNERTDEANARLLRRAKEFITTKPASAAITSPEEPGNLPWTFFSVTDYVRTLGLFHSKSPHFPGRLKPETEAAMKEALWLWVSDESGLTDISANDLLTFLGTENHDLNRRPAYYLVTALLQDDPAYRDRKLQDGRTTAEHATAYTAFFREWPRRRAQSGLWVEVGSNTYQKYSWPSLFNLHELAPDPVVRDRFGLLLDLACIEEAQISVKGRRGGAISRGEYAPNSFTGSKNLLFAVEGQPAGSSHSRVIETSRYQLPAEAILLAKRTFPAAEPFAIRNRILGQLAAAKSPGSHSQRIDPDSALLNYAWRAPHFLLGSSLMDPRIHYAEISTQKQACGMLFDDPSSSELCSVHTVIGHGPGGRPVRSYWSVQHQNVLLLQRIPPVGKTYPGSYNTDAIGIGFEGKALQKMEKDGWIFASNGKAFVGVRFLDGTYQWDTKRAVATPANFTKASDKSRILLVAGDLSSGDSFEKFQATVLANPPRVSPDKVDYEFGPAKDRIEMTSYDPRNPDQFTLPLINGQPVNLHPAATYQSPYLNGTFNGDQFTVTVGPIRRVLDFSGSGK